VSLKPTPIQPVPEETVRIARAAFRKGNPLLKLRDELGAIFADADFTDLFPKLGQPGLPPWRLALVTLLQFREDLPDRQAAEAVRARIDWKYLLGLELTDPGFDHSVLCEFRSRLLTGSAEERLLHKLLEACQARGLLKARGRQRTDATHVLASIRTLDRLDRPGTAAELRGLPKVVTLRQVWARQFVREPAEPPADGGTVRLRGKGDPPPEAEPIESPYDPQARFRTRSGTSWVGYIVHLSESCEDDGVHLITHAMTTTAAVHEARCTAAIHAALAGKGLVPGEHLVDAGYVDAELLVRGREDHGIDLVGPRA
jgi:transposase